MDNEITSYWEDINVGDLIHFEYTNHKGVKANRKAIVKGFAYGRTDYHMEYQFLIIAFDVDKLEERVFAAKDISALVIVEV